MLGASGNGAQQAVPSALDSDCGPKWAFGRRAGLGAENNAMRGATRARSGAACRHIDRGRRTVDLRSRRGSVIRLPQDAVDGLYVLAANTTS